jgi:hypothetical protein
MRLWQCAVVELDAYDIRRFRSPCLDRLRGVMIGQPSCDELAGRSKQRSSAFDPRQRHLAKPTIEHLTAKRLRKPLPYGLPQISIAASRARAYVRKGILWKDKIWEEPLFRVRCFAVPGLLLRCSGSRRSGFRRLTRNRCSGLL